MEVANCRLRLNKVGSDVPLNDVTPAEAMLLHILHGPANGGSTFGEEFDKITITGSAKVVVKAAVVAPYEPPVGKAGDTGYKPEVLAKETSPAILRDRTDAEELRRLSTKYNGARDKHNEPIIKSVWPDKFNPKLPQTFKELNWQEIGAAGLEVAAVNYATGGLATPSLTAKK